MKFIITTIIIFYMQPIFGQSKICTITEQFSGLGNTTIDRLVVTDSLSKTSTQEITHFIKDVAAHDLQFHSVLNDFLKQGYDIINPSPLEHGDMIGGVSVFTRTWFLIKNNRPRF